jgi:hypothetical protein
MKKNILFTLALLCLLNLTLFAQNRSRSSEKHGTTFNIGIGPGYYGYIGHPVSVIKMNIEFDVAKNFTLAPFVGFYSYTNRYYWGNKQYPSRYYNYRETVIPIGLKGAYYFDDAFDAGSKWDFYAAASLGFSYHRQTWDNDYYGDKDYYKGSSPLYLHGHLGTRFHLNNKAAIFLDLSTGFSTIGASFKLN